MGTERTILYTGAWGLHGSLSLTPSTAFTHFPSNSTVIPPFLISFVGFCVCVSEHGSAAFASFPNVLYSSVPFYLSILPAVSLPWVEMWTLILDHTFITQESAKS